MPEAAGERRLLPVMFYDLVDSTDIATRLVRGLCWDQALFRRPVAQR